MRKDIATGVTICLLLMIVATNVPVIGSLSALLLPPAVLFFRLRLGPEKGVAVPAAAWVAVALVSGPATTDMLVMAALMVLGYGLGHLINRGWPLEAVVIGACTLSLAAGTAAVFMASALAGQGVVAMIDAQVGQHLTTAMALYRSMGIGEEQLQTLADNIDQIRYVLVRLLPGLAVMAVLVASWISLLIARPLLARLAMPATGFGPLRLWKAPDQLVWAAIACGALLILPGRDLKILGLNGIVVLMTVYFFQGMAIVAFVFDKKRFPRPLRGAFYGLIAVQQMLVLLIVAAGFFDIWLNFRKLNNQQPP